MNRPNSCGDCRFFYLSDPHRMMGVCCLNKKTQPTETFEGNITIECPNCGEYFEPKEDEP